MEYRAELNVRVTVVLGGTHAKMNAWIENPATPSTAGSIVDMFVPLSEQLEARALFERAIASGIETELCRIASEIDRQKREIE